MQIKERKMSVPIETEVAGLGLSAEKSVYVDVKPHLEDNTTTLVVDVIDSHDVQYAAIAGTRNKHVSLHIIL